MPTFVGARAPRRFAIAGLLLAAAGLVAALFAARPALADSAVLTKSGTLYEVFSARYGDVVAGASGTADARIPVLALRTTPSNGSPTLEIVDGTLDSNEEDSASIEYDEATGTIFVVYDKYQGLMADLHLVVRRGGRWLEQNILPNPGLYLSINPKLLITRQKFTDLDRFGNPITKSRSIVSVIWWEESGVSQARYACLFVEDGVLRLDTVTAYNLNEFTGAPGPTMAAGLPFSSYQFPALQRDVTTNGGFLVSFANLANQTQTTVRITFPDDIRLLIPPGATTVTQDAYARAHIPVGRQLGAVAIPLKIDVLSPVGTAISSGGVPTFFWTEGDRFRFLRGDAAPEENPTVIPLRGDFGPDRALSLVRDMIEKE